MTDCSVSKNRIIDNRGFSLVELIVCIAILAIAAVPLYQSMTVSIRTNAKAQSKQNATSLAEEVMEEIKSSSINELKARYNDPAKVTPVDEPLGMNESTFWISDDKTGVDRGAHTKLKNLTADAMLTGDFTDEPFYVLYKYKASAAQDNETFNVIATLRTSPYMKDDNASASDANSKKLPKIEEVDPLSQCVISAKEFAKYDKAAADYFNQDGASLTGDTIDTKEIIIDKSDTYPAHPHVPYDQESVDCRVVYTSTSGKTFSRELFSGTYGQPVRYDDEGHEIGREDLVSNIYLFYKRTQPKEKITISDTATINQTQDTHEDIPHKVFLIMQEDVGEGAALTIKHSEAEYTIVEVNDGSGTLLLDTPDGNDIFDDNSDLNDDGDIISDDEKYELITNMTQGGDIGHIYNEEAHIRIYDVDVSLIRDGEEYAHLHSTKEAND